MTITPVEIPLDSNRRILQRTPVAVCYIADRLAEEEFEEAPYIRLESLRICCAPEIDHAQISYLYGNISREDDTEIAYYPPIDLAGKFIKVVIPDQVYADYVEGVIASSSLTAAQIIAGTNFNESAQQAINGSPEPIENKPIVWYGIIEHDDRETLGVSAAGLVSSSSDAFDARGEQHLTAFGLLRLLEKEVVDISFVDIDGTVDNVFVARAGLNFNADHAGQYTRRGNRSATKVGLSYIFNWEPRGQYIWTAHNAVEYLLETQVPLDSEGDQANKWYLDSNVDYLDWYNIDVRTNGRTVKELLDELMPRHRGVGYYVTFNPAPDGSSSSSSSLYPDDSIILHVFTFVSEDLPLPNGQTLVANPNQVTMDLEGILDVTDHTVTNTMLTKYHRIIARGEKRTTTFTHKISMEPAVDAAIYAAWDVSDEDEYIDGASRAADYDGLTLAQQQARNAVARSSHRLDEVFRRFVLNQTLKWAPVIPAGSSSSSSVPVDTRWDCLIPDPLGNSPNLYWLRGSQGRLPFSALYDPASSYDGRDYIPGVRIHRALPLYEKYDYGEDRLSTFDYKTAFAPHRQPSFVPPFIFAPTGTRTLIDYFSSSSSSSTRSVQTFEMLDRLNRSYTAAGDRTWSARLSVSDTEPGFEIHATVPHFIFGNTKAGWAELAKHEDQSVNKGIPYHVMFATLCVELTQHVQAEFLLAETADGAPEQVLIINVPNARHDYILPYTVVEIKDGLPIQTTSGGFARNSMPRLMAIAQASGVWYGQERQTLDFAMRQLRSLFSLGMLVTSIGEDYSETELEDPEFEASSSSSSAPTVTPINTPITAITYTLGAGNRGHTRIETAFTNLDFVAGGD